MERIGNVWIYPVDLKGAAKAFVMPCIEGYTVYVDRNLPKDEQIAAARHELDHIANDDFSREDVQLIEWERHGEGEKNALGEMEDSAGREGTADLHHRGLEAGG